MNFLLHWIQLLAQARENLDKVLEPVVEQNESVVDEFSLLAEELTTSSGAIQRFLCHQCRKLRQTVTVALLPRAASRSNPVALLHQPTACWA